MYNEKEDEEEKEKEKNEKKLNNQVLIIENQSNKDFISF